LNLPPEYGVSGGPSMTAFHEKKSDCDFGSAVQRAMGSLHSCANSDVSRLMALSLDEDMPKAEKSNNKVLYFA
jgi:hypothetical protein